MLFLLSLILSARSAPAPEFLENADIPTFTGVDWTKSRKACYDTSTDGYVLLGKKFYLECSICTCDRNGFWCVLKCDNYMNDLTNCLEFLNVEDECCPRTECLRYGNNPSPSWVRETAASKEKTLMETTKDPSATTEWTTDDVTSSSSFGSSTTWTTPEDASEDMTTLYENYKHKEGTDVWTTYSKPDTTHSSQPGIWYEEEATMESYLEWLLQQIEWE